MSAKKKSLSNQKSDQSLPKRALRLNLRDIMDFIEFPQFTRRWDYLGLNDEGDLASLQISIAVDPKGAPVVSGTEGLRKMRFSPPKWQVGRSGALRVLYVYFERFRIVLLMLVYEKSEIDEISPVVKTKLNQLILQSERELERISRIRRP